MELLRTICGPFHDFLLLACPDHQFPNYRDFINDPRAVRIDDDMLRDLSD